MPIDLLHTSFYWHASAGEVLQKLGTGEQGLPDAEVLRRQKQYGLNTIRRSRINFLTILVRQFTGNPLIIVLSLATFVSYLLGQQVSSYYIFTMILVSISLGLWNEWSAVHTVETLLRKISPTAIVTRKGEKVEISVTQLTVGDMVHVSPGSIIPADLRLIAAKDLELNQSALTGESKTIFKTSELMAKSPVSTLAVDNIAFMGATVVAGSATGVVIQIGKETEYGRIAETSSFIKPTTDFQKGLAKFGQLIVYVILVMMIVIFAVNAILGHPVIDSLLFSLAIAVGLTPELLPVIVTVSLAHGAGLLAKKHVVTKQLISIENLGNMDILCTDKTGTLTEGQITVTGYYDAQEKSNRKILGYGLLANGAVWHHKAVGNAIDVAMWEYATKHGIAAPKDRKIDEEPFDYARKAMYAAIREEGKVLLIAKGAPDAILASCTKTTVAERLYQRMQQLAADGIRTVAIATKSVSEKTKYSWDDLNKMKLVGYITFLDVPKTSAKTAIERLRALHVAVKIVTGDNEIVTRKICSEVGMPVRRILTGAQIAELTDKELADQAIETDVFARVTPEQKLKIIDVLRAQGHTVGYMGDGINDLPPLHSADVGISVNTAVDVAKDAASIVLLRKGLDVLYEGIVEGRKTFSNTIKYILMATSSNFGNMFSAAGSSFFLPFLPMTPVQILLTNGLYDISQLSIPTDNVDAESLLKPRHWNIGFIKNYMLFFGPLSSLFDFATFALMLSVFHARGALFQTGWFIESVATEILVVFVIRTARTPFFRSLPGKWLTLTCLALVIVALILPFSPFASTMGFVAPPPAYFGFLLLFVVMYLTLVETVKSVFLKKYSL